MKADETQKISFRKLKESGKDVTEEREIIMLLDRLNKPVNYHEIMRLTGLPINHCVRAINGLKKLRHNGKPYIETVERKKCQETGRLVSYYKLVNQLKDELR